LRERIYYSKPEGEIMKQVQSSAEPPSRRYLDLYLKDQSELVSEVVPCKSPHIELHDRSGEELINPYHRFPSNIFVPFIGSANAIGLQSDVCATWKQRYRPFREGKSKIPSAIPVPWHQIQWGELQEICIERNQHRFVPEVPDLVLEISKVVSKKLIPDITSVDEKQQYLPGHLLQSRKAILLRTWEGYNYSTNDLANIRAMITELSLQTGGEYQVFLFVNVKDQSEKIHADPQAYERVLNRAVPPELRSITILWSEDICQDMYPEVGDWKVHWHQYMPVQWFSKLHPEFEFIWNWEMDVRYTGNYYNLLNRISKFAVHQPRKYLWERNSRFYIPSFHGESYDIYLHDTNQIIEQSAADGKIAEPIWGPQPYDTLQRPLGSHAPIPQELDDFEWGVGEDADLITLLPIFDPINTEWEMRHKIWNFSPGVRPQFGPSDPAGNQFNSPLYANLSRRAYINTTIRLSRELLNAMHIENQAGRSMQAEMWPSTVALHHGFKAVYAPHPIYSSRQWPARYADAVFNADGGIPGRWSQEVDSVYNRDREANFRSITWYFDSLFPKALYRRWMDWEVEETADTSAAVGDDEWETKDGPSGSMCLPPMLLHPVKRKDLDPA
jgi:hypothetical protein